MKSVIRKVETSGFNPRISVYGRQMKMSTELREVLVIVEVRDGKDRASTRFKQSWDITYDAGRIAKEIKGAAEEIE